MSKAKRIVSLGAVVAAIILLINHRPDLAAVQMLLAIWIKP